MPEGPKTAVPPPSMGLGGFAPKIAELALEAVGAILPLEAVRSWIGQAAEGAVPGATAAALLVQVQTRAAYLAQLSRAWSTAKAQLGPQLAEFAAFGLQELFGINVAAGALTGAAGSEIRRSLAGTIGGQVLEALFKQAASGSGVSDGQGWQNAVSLVDASIKMGLEGWITKNVGLGFLTKEFPDVGDLDELIARKLGLGRIVTRGLRTAVDVLIADPAKRYLLSVFQPNVPTESQLLKLLNRGFLSEGAYFEEMARLGWNRQLSAEFKALGAVYPSRSDLARFYQAGLMDKPALAAAFVAQGFRKEDADRLAFVVAEDRLDDFQRAAVTEALGQYVDRVLDEPELRAIAETALYTAAETDAIVALGNLRRARPKLLTATQRQQAFDAELMDADDLRYSFEQEGFRPSDVNVLMALAVAKKAKADLAAARAAERRAPGVPAPLPRTVAEEAYRRGLIQEPELVARYTALKLPADQQAILLGTARARRTDYQAALQAKQAPPEALTARPAAVEEAYVRAIVTRDELRDFYESQGFSGDALELLLKVRDAERADADAARERARARLESTGTTGGL